MSHRRNASVPELVLRSVILLDGPAIGSKPANPMDHSRLGPPSPSLGIFFQGKGIGSR